jgi:RimJ/RimL family protein N-acetyltransferase
MKIEVITSKEYQDVLSNAYQIFNSANFNELNKEKCDRIHYLIFRDTKIRLGLIIGQRGDKVFSPFSAPFGCFSFVNEKIEIKQIDEAVQELDNYLKENNISSIKFVLPPLFYNVSFLSKLVNALNRNHYNIAYIDLNYIFKTVLIDENYIDKILHSNARRNLNRALKQNLIFQKTENIDIVYDIIQKNRESRGFSLRMTLQQVKETIKIIKWDGFVVQTDNNFIASALIYHVAKDIVQVIYWGDIPEFSLKKTMNYLSNKIFEYYKNTGIKIVDIGTSTEKGIPNYGLCEFKKSIGCSVEPKFTFEKDILNTKFVDYNKIFLEKSWEWLNDTEMKKLTLTPALTKEMQQNFFDSLPKRNDYFIKGILCNNKPIGACGLKNLTEEEGEYWGYIGEKGYWGRGIGKEMVKFIIEFAKQKQLKNIWLRVFEKNERAYNLYTKNNFIEEDKISGVIIMRLHL